MSKIPYVGNMPNGARHSSHSQQNAGEGGDRYKIQNESFQSKNKIPEFTLEYLWKSRHWTTTYCASTMMHSMRGGCGSVPDWPGQVTRFSD
jgi:hypothetical protein